MRRFPAVALSILLLTSCVSTQDSAIRTRPAVAEPPVIDIAFDDLEKSPVDTRLLKTSPFERIWFTAGGQKVSYNITSLELDDEGTLFQPMQIDTVTSRIREEAKDRGAIIVVFVHGWKHNATPCDDNLSCFRTVMRKLAEQEHLAGRKRVVSGVYVGWRGLSYCNEPGKEVSFYGRKMAAERVGAAQAREIMQNLRDLHEDLGETYPNINSRLVIVGHSFGAALVHSAVLPDMHQDILFARRKAEEKKTKQLDLLFGYGDLVVLVNPAFEAQRFHGLPHEIASLQSDGYAFDPRQKPIYVVVSSVADKPTHYAFPAGQFLSLLFQPLKLIRGPFYWARYLTTAGNFTPYRTHTAEQIEELPSGKQESNPDTCFRGLVPDQYQACGCDQATFAEMTEAIAAGATKSTTESQDVYGNVLLTRHDKWPVHDPFWVVKAEKDVIASHNDVFNPTFVSFLHGLVTQADRGY